MVLAAYPPVDRGAQPARSNFEIARAYLRLLYGDQAPGYLNLCCFDGTPIEWFPSCELDRIAERSVALSGSHNVYHSIAPRSDAFYRGLSEKARGKERGGSDAAGALPGLWLDVDFADAAHQKTNLPPTPESALALIAEFPLRPTLVVHSGHGFQAWFLFESLWALDTGEDRRRAETLLRRFHRAMLARAKAHGWTLDNTSELARVFRVAGTVNRKDPEHTVPVTVLFCDPARRYRVEDLDRHLPDGLPTPISVPSQAAPVGASPAPNLSDEELLRRAMAARNGEKFTRLWAGDTSENDHDQNAADLALCDILAFWANRDGARVDRLFRQSGLFRAKWDEPHYAGGEKYGEHTVALALAGVAQGYTGANPPLAADDCRDCRDEDRPDGSGEEAEPCADLLTEVAYLREELARARLEIATVRRIHTQQWRVFANKNLKGVGVTATRLASAYSSAHGRDMLAHDGWMPITLSGKYGLGAEVGKSDRRVSDDVKKLDEWGFLERHTITDRIEEGPAMGQLRTHMFVRFPAEPLVALEQLATFDPERPTWGGKRTPRCEDHPDADVVRTTTYICSECGQLLGEPHKQTLHTTGAGAFSDPTSCQAGDADDLDVESTNTDVDTGTLGGQDDGSGMPIVGLPPPTDDADWLPGMVAALWPTAQLVMMPDMGAGP